MKTTAEMIAVMQAFERGEVIEVNSRLRGEWLTATAPSWDWAHSDYRIKPREPRVIWVNEYDNHEDMVHDDEGEARRKAGPGATRTAVKYIEAIE